ncbi:MAG: DUF4377 domain-containing protein [Dysgonomonas sp.]|nr:DUF4377 domain-containing protein [Dysgonomonas sp.]
MKKTLFFLLLLPLVFGGFTSCSDDDDNDTQIFTVTIASVKQVENGNELTYPYFAKKEGSTDWASLEYIEGFEHEDGYEYVLEVERKKWHNGSIMDAPTHKCKLLEIISKTQKTSENIPEQAAHMIIASKRPIGTEATSFFVRYMAKDEWFIIPEEGFEGLEYEEGFEYYIQAKLVFMGHDKGPVYKYSLTKMFKKEEKDTQGLPL